MTKEHRFYQWEKIACMKKEPYTQQEILEIVKELIKLGNTAEDVVVYTSILQRIYADQHIK